MDTLIAIRIVWLSEIQNTNTSGSQSPPNFPNQEPSLANVYRRLILPQLYKLFGKKDSDIHFFEEKMTRCPSIELPVFKRNRGARWIL